MRLARRRQETSDREPSVEIILERQQDASGLETGDKEGKMVQRRSDVAGGYLKNSGPLGLSSWFS